MKTLNVLNNKTGKIDRFENKDVRQALQALKNLGYRLERVLPDEWDALEGNTCHFTLWIENK
jgi:hypothetical protein